MQYAAARSRKEVLEARAEMDVLWEYWTWMAEETGLALSCDSLTTDTTTPPLCPWHDGQGLPLVFEQLRQFGLIVRLQLNLSKSAFLTKGMWPDRYITILNSFGIDLKKKKVKYLGILLGHVTSEEAYAPVLARATLRAHFMSNLPLTQDEHVALFQEWVLPLFIFPGRGYFPRDQVVAKLSVIYKVALRLNSWGLTLSIMAMPPPPPLGREPCATTTYVPALAACHAVHTIQTRAAGSARAVPATLRSMGAPPRCVPGW